MKCIKEALLEGSWELEDYKSKVAGPQGRLLSTKQPGGVSQTDDSLLIFHDALWQLEQDAKVKEDKTRISAFLKASEIPTGRARQKVIID